MARFALLLQMSARQRELSSRVIESRAPARSGEQMALCTVRGESCGEVVGTLCFFVIRLVTRNTGDWKPAVAPAGVARVTIGTFGGHVSAEEGKARLIMLLPHVWNTPGDGGMTVGAVGSKFTHVCIGMAG